MTRIVQNNDSIICVKATMHLKSSEEGGKTNPVRTGYRPNHAFEQPSDIRDLKTYIGEVQFSDEEFFYPGKSKDVTVMFLRFGNIENYLLVGQKWFIYEVPKLVGEAEIREVIYFS